ncbi:MAG: glycoside hydrolase family 9 protein [Cytophagaceae bacterium]|jgi:endoglucanase|nr:glycoside hydrolase family 9 protein [Cytophagaceae bacterium]
MIRKAIFTTWLISAGLGYAQQSDNVRVNQIGFYPSGAKVGIVVDAKSPDFYLLNVQTKDTAFKGTLKNAGVWEYSAENAFKADFTKFNKPGTYVLGSRGVGESFPFEIKEKAHLALGKGLLRFYYYQRASIDLPEQFAGKVFARKAGHPDNQVYVHASAATEKRPENTVISSPKGWYDAGDYNKYIVNSGISTYTLLALYEHYPKYFDTLNLNIPESGNKTPDILDEILWNVRWMITMQDPDDGGVYHKLTNANFDGSIMPEAANNKRWVVQKSTAATLDFAAVMAMSSRIYKKYNKPFADSCLKAAIYAYQWAKKNPNKLYNQPLMNAKFNPDVQTGAYDDANVTDEFQWAAIELFVATGKSSYFEDANVEYSLRSGFGLPGWQSVNTLGLYTLAFHRSRYPELKEVMDQVKDKLVSMAAEYKEYALSKSQFGVAMGKDKSDFNWGSNSFAANEGMMLMMAYEVTGEGAFLDAAQSNLDYLLGRNGTNYSYVTAFGEKSTRNPHHRPSEADNVEDPVPGMLSGGPNPGQEDGGNCGGKYTSKLPAKSFIDDKCSYASNEVAINWNAPIAYLVFALEANKK